MFSIGRAMIDCVSIAILLHGFPHACFCALSQTFVHFGQPSVVDPALLAGSKASSSADSSSAFASRSNSSPSAAAPAGVESSLELTPHDRQTSAALLELLSHEETEERKLREAETLNDLAGSVTNDTLSTSDSRSSFASQSQSQLPSGVAQPSFELSMLHAPLPCVNNATFTMRLSLLAETPQLDRLFEILFSMFTLPDREAKYAVVLLGFWFLGCVLRVFCV